MFNIRHPFFRPAWRRVLVVAITAGWAVMEFLLGNTVWAAAFGAIAAYCGYEFFIRFDPADYEDEDR